MTITHPGETLNNITVIRLTPGRALLLGSHTPPADVAAEFAGWDRELGWSPAGTRSVLFTQPDTAGNG